MDVIDQITEARSYNNNNWMDLLRLAMRVAPRETQQIVKRINNTDQRISELLFLLTRDSSGE